MSFAGSEDAAATLDALAAGAAPDRTRAIVGALALDALTWATSSRDILDAAAGLAIIATGGTLDLDDAGAFARAISPMPSVSNARRRNKSPAARSDEPRRRRHRGQWEIYYE